MSRKKQPLKPKRKRAGKFFLHRFLNQCEHNVTKRKNKIFDTRCFSLYVFGERYGIKRCAVFYRGKWNISFKFCQEANLGGSYDQQINKTAFIDANDQSELEDLIRKHKSSTLSPADGLTTTVADGRDNTLTSAGLGINGLTMDINTTAQDISEEKDEDSTTSDSESLTGWTKVRRYYKRNFQKLFRNFFDFFFVSVCSHCLTSRRPCIINLHVYFNWCQHILQCRTTVRTAIEGETIEFNYRSKNRILSRNVEISSSKRIDLWRFSFSRGRTNAKSYRLIIQIVWGISHDFFRSER